jgi:hypothetical protein
MRRPSYFTFDQGTGALFYRGIAVEYWHRAESFWPLRTLDFGQTGVCPNLDKVEKPDRTRADLETVCDPEPALDYPVLIRPVPNANANVWVSAVRFQQPAIINGRAALPDTNRFYVYSCADVR